MDSQTANPLIFRTEKIYNLPFNNLKLDFLFIPVLNDILDIVEINSYVFISVTIINATGTPNVIKTMALMNGQINPRIVPTIVKANISHWNNFL